MGILFYSLIILLQPLANKPGPFLSALLNYMFQPPLCLGVFSPHSGCMCLYLLSRETLERSPSISQQRLGQQFAGSL